MDTMKYVDTLALDGEQEIGSQPIESLVITSNEWI